MKKFATLLLLAITCIIPLEGMAQDNRTTFPTLSKLTTTWSETTVNGLNLQSFDILDYGQHKLYLPKQRYATTAADSITLTIKTTTDTTGFNPGRVDVYNADALLTSRSLSNGDSVAEIRVPVGVYDIACLYSNPNYMNKLDIHENIQLDKDTTITISSYNATRHLRFRCYNPDGELWKIRTVKSRYETDSVLSMGNAYSVDVYTFIYSPYSNVVASYASAVEYDSNGDPTCDSVQDVYVSPVSDRYCFAQSRTQVDYDGKVYINKLKLSGTDVDYVANNPSNYTAYSERFQMPETAKSEFYVGGYSNHSVYGSDLDGATLAYSGMFTQGKNDPVTIYTDVLKDKSSQPFNVAVSLSLSNPEPTSVPNQYNSYPINSTPMLFDGTTREYAFPGDYYGNTYKQVDGLKKLDFFPGHPLFAFTNKQYTGTFGDNVPVLDFYYAASNYNGRLYYTMTNTAMGRYGETNRTYLSDMKVTVLHDGVDVGYSTYDSLFSTFSMDWFQKRMPLGKMDITLSDSCTNVDGIRGFITVNAKYDETKTDMWVPRLRMIQLRDKDNNVTDRFATKDDGTMFFVATDANYNSSDRAFTISRPSTLELYYRPTGTTEWLSLPYTELTDYAYYNYGFTYEASLANVTEESKTGWYDVKAYLADEAGNTYEEILGPVFKIGSASTGINSIENNTSSLIKVYDVQGRLITATENASSINLPKGIYILKNAKTGESKKILAK